jgi:formylglycine-generating enzyme required for sulfatase activity
MCVKRRILFRVTITPLLKLENRCQAVRILAILLLILSSTGCVQAAEQSPADHFHSSQVCAGCHPGGVDVALILKQNNNSCLSCHTLAEIQEKLIRANNKSKAANVPVTNKTPAGMRYPMYNDASRIGNEANKMVTVPAGEFIRGTDARLPDEGPQHRRHVEAFMIDIYEVTNAQYKAFIDATQRKSPDHFRNRTYPAGKADHPVTYVSWHDANAYCAWAGKRLPSDIEWEKAARGTKGQEYPWGDKFDITKANMPLRWEKLGEAGDTTPVGAFAGGVSPYGAYDMTGNVWEWTASWYEAYPGNMLASENYGQRYKTLKGGSWFDCSFYKCGISAPVYNRAFFAQRTKNDSFGFRCAK